MLAPADRAPTVQPTNFSVTIRQAGPISLLDVVGRLTSFEIGALRDAISRLLKQGRKNIVLNLSGLEYLDSSGIGELARVYVSVVKADGQMKVVGLSEKVEEILKITQLYQVFPEFPSEEAALESFPESSRKESL
jgi:anti-sigma B factor antagonist